jgi:uncharacterized protein
MEWEGREESQNVEDQRGFPTKAVAIGGGGVVIVVLALLLGLNPQMLLDLFGQRGEPQPQQVQKDPHEERLARFTKVILHDTEEVWDDLFKKMGKRYEKPHLVLFSGSVRSACGLADTAVGPFYCPADSKLYIDLSFYRDMERKLNAPGEFARAYVIAHEVGHHVQHLLGYSQRGSPGGPGRGSGSRNQMSVRLELQADYLAGVWAHWGQKRFKFLQKGDLESALHAAFQIGDDRLQRRSRGYVVPDSFTHGTSEQRVRWFRRGFKTGSVKGAAALFKLPYDEL